MTRRLVIPGELIKEGKYKLGNGVFKEKDKIFSSVLGLLDEKETFIRVIPLTGKYIPKEGDFVIGKIIDIQFSNWKVDINSAYSAILNASDYFRDIDIFKTELIKILAPGDLIFARVREVTPRKKVYITMKEREARVIKGGRILKVTPPKVPRIIGKRSSMISMIQRETKCRILAGQNGRIWISGKPELAEIAAKMIERIEEEAHTSGLTNRIKETIKKEKEREKR